MSLFAMSEGMSRFVDIGVERDPNEACSLTIDRDMGHRDPGRLGFFGDVMSQSFPWLKTI